MNQTTLTEPAVEPRTSATAPGHAHAATSWPARMWRDRPFVTVTCFVLMRVWIFHGERAEAETVA